MVPQRSGSLTVWLFPLCATAFVACAVLTGLVRKHALRVGLMDEPNARSSHSESTPRGGGLALVVAFCASSIIASGAGIVEWRFVWAMVLPGGLVAFIGWRDDHGHVPALRRLLVHLAACALAIAVIALSSDNLLTPDPHWSIGVVALTWIACGWFLNLFNFMDGIDGIAASEAAFVSFAAAALLTDAGGLVVLWAVLGSTALGFLLWNWAPARIFMGDVGSGFLGCIIATLLIASDLYSEKFSAWTALALAGPFASDATVTLLRRTIRGERWYSAHRSHAYQWLARRWRSHARVTTLLALLNLTVALPLAWATMARPPVAPILACGGFAAFCMLALAAGAGREEESAA